MTWVSPTTNCALTKYLVVYSGEVLWSNDTCSGTDEKPPSQSSYVDLDGLTPWTNYSVCVAGVINGSLVGAYNCCVATTLEAGEDHDVTADTASDPVLAGAGAP